VTKAKRKYKRNKKQIKWYMGQYSFDKIMALKTLDGYPLYPEMRQDTPKLMGYEIVLTDEGFVQDSTEDIG
jgi:HK97 family phage major capsid protein